jgi:peptidoglycan/xylan/chitin deacetylase (PgdA/CDA1 family)
MAARELTLGGAPVLMYHGLGASAPADLGEREHKYWISTGSFGWQLAMIRGRGHRVVGLYDYWAGEDDQGRAPSPVVLTFDDGRASDYEVAFPMLLASGVQAEFFINTATVGQRGYLTWTRIAEMQRAGMSFQSHAHDHVALPALPALHLSNALRISKRLIEDRVGRAVDFLAAPHGLVDRRVLDAARDAGYQAVCASRGWPARPGAAIVNRVTVLRDTTEMQFSAILARQPRAYVPAIARTLLDRLRQRAARARFDNQPVSWSAHAKNGKASP